MKVAATTTKERKRTTAVKPSEYCRKQGFFWGKTSDLHCCGCYSCDLAAIRPRSAAQRLLHENATLPTISSHSRPTISHRYRPLLTTEGLVENLSTANRKNTKSNAPFTVSNIVNGKQLVSSYYSTSISRNIYLMRNASNTLFLILSLLLGHTSLTHYPFF